MIGFMMDFARRARAFTDGPDRPVAWIELDPMGLLVRAAHRDARCNYLMTWEQVANIKPEVRDAAIDLAIVRAAKPIMDRLEARSKEQAI